MTQEPKFRKNHILNSSKHTIEFTDTDGFESLKIQHSSGSFKEFNNFSTIEYSPSQNQKLIVGDQFETINSNDNLHVGMDKSTTVRGDEYETVGSNNTNAASQIRAILTSIHEYMQLFDVRRTRQYTPDEQILARGELKGVSQLPNFISPLQTKQRNSRPINPVTINAKGHTVCPKCLNGRAGTQAFDVGIYINGLTPRKLLFTPALFFTCDLPTPVLGFASGLPTQIFDFPAPEDITLGTTLAQFNGRPGFYQGAKCDVCNSDLLFTPDKQPGFSPSTFGGDFEPETRKLPGGELERTILNFTPQLVELDKQLSGGDKIVNISKNKIEKIGLVVNDLPSIRVDPIGKLRIESVYVSPGSTYVSVRPSPHIEPVAPISTPGGDYILTVGNKYKLLVGANGINMKTFGPLDLYGTLVNFSGQQINIHSQFETNIDGGDRINIRARKISFNPKEHSPVVVDGSLHVARNAIFGGGSYVEGQFATPNIASVREIAETSDAVWEPTGETSYIACGAANVGGVDGEAYVVIPPHRHLYERPAMRLFNSIEALRSFMSSPGGSNASINDTRNVTAAAAANNTGLGKYSLALNTYIIVIQNQLSRVLNPASQWGATSVADPVATITTFNNNEANTQIDGSIRASFFYTATQQSFRSRRNNTSASVTVTINFKIAINPETTEFQSIISRPTITNIQGAGNLQDKLISVLRNTFSISIS